MLLLHATAWLRGFFLVAGPIFVGVCVAAEELLMLLYGEQWRPAAGTCLWLAVAGLFASFTLAVYPTLLAIGRPRTILGLNVFFCDPRVACSVVGRGSRGKLDGGSAG
jgi:O-antigen/teichoic acid export membrane protein